MQEEAKVKIQEEDRAWGSGLSLDNIIGCDAENEFTEVKSKPKPKKNTKKRKPTEPEAKDSRPKQYKGKDTKPKEVGKFKPKNPKGPNAKQDAEGGFKRKPRQD